MNKLKAIPIGHEDFKELIDDNCYYVDKTLMIKEIIDNCAHPDYKELLWDYLKIAQKGHTSHRINAALAMHDTLLKKGDMRLIDWNEYL